MTLDDALTELPIVAIARGLQPDEAAAHGEAFLAGGVRVLEVPLNSPQPLESIRRLVDAMAGRMVIGAGTVLRAEDVDAVDHAGGTLIVSPDTNPAVIARAVELGLDPAPGFATATEAFAAIRAGARRLKLFPAVTYGHAHLKQLNAVLPPDVQVWAVGGVGPADLAGWRAAGATGFGIGSEIYRPGQTPADSEARARAFADAWRQATR